MYNLVTWVYPFGEEDREFRKIMCDFIQGGVIYNDKFLESRLKFETNYVKFFPLELNTFCYGVSGSEAIEHALMIVEHMTGKHKFLFFTGGYHGSSTTLLNVTYHEKYSRLNHFEFVEVSPPYCYRCSRACSGHDCIQDIFINIPEDNEFAGFIIDPSFGNILLDVEDIYYKRISEECKKRNILIIFDEVRTGFGRLGYEFGFMKYNVIPDVLCLSKSIACGLPLALTIYDGNQLSDSFRKSFHFMLETTFAGFELSLNMANYTLDRLHRQPDFCMDAAKYFAARLQELKCFEVVGDVRNNGMLFAIEFIQQLSGMPSKLKALHFANKVRTRNIIINNPAYSSVILLHPYLSITKAEIDEIILVFKECLEAM